MIYYFYSSTILSPKLIKEKRNYDTSIEHFILRWRNLREEFKYTRQYKWHTAMYVEDAETQRCYQLFPVYKELSDKELSFLKLSAENEE